MAIAFTLKHPRVTQDMLGFLPAFWDEGDPRSAKEQANDAYRHGGGWRTSTAKFTITDAGLTYPGDPPMVLIAEAQLREETIRLYDGSWVAIVQKDGTFEVSRMD